jgi:DDE superfamily endonuclease
MGEVAERLVRSRRETSPGRLPAKRMGEEAELGVPAAMGLLQDTGCQGYHLAGVHRYQPKKKPTGKELTAEEKAANKSISRSRMLMAHSMAGVQRGRIVQEVFRQTKRYFADQVMEIACGVHNVNMTLRYNRLE